MRELPPPPLELFDLDEAFSSEKTRLAQMTNKCMPKKEDDNYDEENNLIYYIQECTQIVRPYNDITEYSNPRQILHDLAVELFQFKKSSVSD